MTLPPTSSLSRYPPGRRMLADSVTEFHAARILLLVHICGKKNQIDGLTKLAKLDFFVRYPAFFMRAKKHLQQDADGETGERTVETVMIRHHYGPWDPRYYQILPYLRARRLVEVGTEGKRVTISLSPAGSRSASQLDDLDEFADLVERMKEVGDAFKSKSGTALKKLIYELFEEEVAALKRGEII